MNTTIIRTALLLAVSLTQTAFTMAKEQAAAQPTFDKLFRNDKPVVPQRGVHMYLAGLPPTPDRFVQLLKLFAAARYNVVVIEWDDSFPWTVDPRFRSPTAYTPEDIRRFSGNRAALGLELIPQVQCLGHMETPLGVPGYEHLREVPNTSSGLNPLNPKARELVLGDGR